MKVRNRSRNWLSINLAEGSLHLSPGQVETISEKNASSSPELLKHVSAGRLVLTKDSAPKEDAPKPVKESEPEAVHPAKKFRKDRDAGDGSGE